MKKRFGKTILLSALIPAFTVTLLAGCGQTGTDSGSAEKEAHFNDMSFTLEGEEVEYDEATFNDITFEARSNLSRQSGRANDYRAPKITVGSVFSLHGHRADDGAKQRSQPQIQERKRGRAKPNAPVLQSRSHAEQNRLRHREHSREIPD